MFGINLTLTPLMRALLAGGAVSGITAAISSNRSHQANTGVAPYGIIFDATGTVAPILTSKPFSELHYSWDFGDPAGGATWARGARPGVASKNTAIGPLAAHVFETPGTYTVTLTVTYYTAAGVLTSATSTQTITVQDPDAVFSGTNTICVANGTLPVAGVNGVPSGAAVANTSNWATVVGYLASYKRVLLKRGDTWAPTATAAPTAAGPGIFGAYGSGALPKISAGAGSIFMLNMSAGFTDWRVMDLEFESSGFANSRGANVSGGGGYCTFVRVFSHHIYGNGLSSSDNGIVYDCETANVLGGNGNNGMYLQSNTYVALLGHYINDVTLGEHCARLQGVKKCVVSNSTFSKPKADGSKICLAVRGWDTGAGNGYAFLGDYTEDVVVTGNALAGAASTMNQYASQQAIADERLRRVLVEGNTYKPTSGSHCISTSVINEMTIRNNIFYGPTDGVSQMSCVQIASFSTFLPHPPSPQETLIYNNSCYSASTGNFSFIYAAVGGSQNPPAATGVVGKNNLAYTPNSPKNILNSNATPTMFATGASGGSTNLCTDYTLINSSSDAQIKSTSPNFATTPPIAISDWRPTSGYAVNGGTYVPVFSDILGATRVYPTPDMGAVNP